MINALSNNIMTPNPSNANPSIRRPIPISFILKNHYFYCHLRLAFSIYYNKFNYKLNILNRFCMF